MLRSRHHCEQQAAHLTTRNAERTPSMLTACTIGFAEQATTFRNYLESAVLGRARWLEARPFPRS